MKLLKRSKSGIALLPTKTTLHVKMEVLGAAISVSLESDHPCYDPLVYLLRSRVQDNMKAKGDLEFEKNSHRITNFILSDSNDGYQIFKDNIDLIGKTFDRGINFVHQLMASYDQYLADTKDLDMSSMNYYTTFRFVACIGGEAI